MSAVTIKGNTVRTIGNLPEKGTDFPDVTLTKVDLSRVSLKEFIGSRLIFNIFPSVDTGVCAASVRKFNKESASLENTKVLCISKDLPFAQARFCGAEGIDSVVMLSDYVSGDFGKKYGVELIDPPLLGLLARSIVVANEKGKIVYVELVPEITTEPDYDKAMQAIKSI